MKTTSDLSVRIKSQPWLITREEHLRLQHLADKRLDFFGPDEEPETPELNLTIEGATAIIPVHGVLSKHPEDWEVRWYGLVDVDQVSAALESVATDSGVRKILLDFRSPGGEVTGIPELGDQIASISKETIAFTDSQCCSGALWLATQARSFYATQSSQVGSCGVYMAFLDVSEYYKEMGVKVNAISAGKFKLAGASFKAMTEAERELFQTSVDKIHAQFKAAVNSRREIEDKFLQGQCFDGDEAVEIGMVDGLVSSISDLMPD